MTGIGQPEILVASWNCSGFAKVNDLVKSHYGSFAAYLDRMKVGILCVQETKVGRRALQTRREAAAAGAVIEGYQSFWSFNESKGKGAGLNGVATWVRDDIVGMHGVRASQKVLEDPLDEEGRCLLVELGGLVVLNVYAHHVDPSLGAHASEVVKAKKLNFLQLIWQLAGRLQDAGKSVIVCGDLNLTWRPADCSLSRCWVEVRGGAIAGRPCLPVDAADGTWVKVGDVTTVSRLRLAMPASEAEVLLPALSASLEVVAAIKLGGASLGAGHSLLSVNGVRVTSLQHASAEVRKCPTLELEFGLGEGVREACEPCHYVAERSCVESLKAVLERSGRLIDTFARVHAGAIGRFSCWNQHLNLRYKNCGARLDYILCDGDLANSLVATSSEQLAGTSELTAGHTAKAAADAATCFGRWHEAPPRALSAGEGGLSLQRDNMRLNDSQFVAAHTGMLYTPPSYSDHIPVCALFRLSDSFGGTLQFSEAGTRACTPWVSQPSLSSFFGRGTKRPLAP